MHKKAALAVGLLLVAAPVFASAQSNTDILAQIQQLKALIAQLQQNPTPPTTPPDSGTPCATLTHNIGPDDTDQDDGGDVTRLQQFLTDTGYYTGSISGHVGPATVRAVQAWQRARGLVSSGDPDSTGYGYVGPKSRDAMACHTTPIATPPSSVTFYVSPDNGAAPLTTNFYINNYTPQPGDFIDLGGSEGQLSLGQTNNQHVYQTPGTYTATIHKCTVHTSAKDCDGSTVIASRIITVTASSTNAPSATIDQSSLSTGSNTPTITGTAKNVSSLYLAISDANGLNAFATDPSTVVNNNWSATVPRTLSPGTYKVSVIGPGYISLATATLTVTAGGASISGVSVNTNQLSLSDSLTVSWTDSTKQSSTSYYIMLWYPDKTHGWTFLGDGTKAGSTYNTSYTGKFSPYVQPGTYIVQVCRLGEPVCAYGPTVTVTASNLNTTAVALRTDSSKIVAGSVLRFSYDVTNAPAGAAIQIDLTGVSNMKDGIYSLVSPYPLDGTTRILDLSQSQTSFPSHGIITFNTSTLYTSDGTLRVKILAADGTVVLTQTTPLSIVNANGGTDPTLKIASSLPAQGSVDVQLNLPQQYTGDYVLYIINPDSVSTPVSSGALLGTNYYVTNANNGVFTAHLGLANAHEGFASNPGGVHWFPLPSGIYHITAVVYPSSPFKPGTDMEYLPIGSEPGALKVFNSPSFQLINGPTQSATLNLSSDPSAPALTSVPGGSTNVVLGTFKVSPVGNVNLTRVAFQLDSGSPNDVTQLYLYNGATLLGSTVFAGTNRTAAITLPTPLALATPVVLTVRGDIAGVGVNQPGVAGDNVKISILSIAGVDTQSGGIVGASVPVSAGPGIVIGTQTQGGALQITAGQQAGNNIAPQGTSLPFTKFTLSNTSSSAITVNGIVFTSVMPSFNPAVTSLTLRDDSGAVVSGPVTPTVNGNQITMPDQFTVPAGQTRNLTLYGNVGTNNAAYSGGTLQFSVVGINTSSVVSGTLPVVGTNYTINTSLDACSNTTLYGFTCWTQATSCSDPHITQPTQGYSLASSPNRTGIGQIFTSDVPLTYALTNSPAWGSFSGNQLTFNVPSTVGTYTFNVTGTNSCGKTATLSLPVIVTNGSAQIDSSSLVSSSQTPTISGTGSAEAVGISISNSGGKVYGSGQIGNQGGRWSHTVTAPLPVGTYTVTVYNYFSNAPLATGILVVGGTVVPPVVSCTLTANGCVPTYYAQARVASVGVYQGTYPPGVSSGFQYHPEATVNVNVTGESGPYSTPVVLVLSSYEPENWVISNAGGNIKKVIAVGYYDQRVTGLDPSIPVETHSLSKDSVFHFAYQYGDTNYIDLNKWVQSLGLRGIDTFTGNYSGTSFSIYVGDKGTAYDKNANLASSLTALLSALKALKSIAQ